MRSEFAKVQMSNIFFVQKLAELTYAAMKDAHTKSVQVNVRILIRRLLVAFGMLTSLKSCQEIFFVLFPPGEIVAPLPQY